MGFNPEDRVTQMKLYASLLQITVIESYNFLIYQSK